MSSRRRISWATAAASILLVGCAGCREEAPGDSPSSSAAGAGGGGGSEPGPQCEAGWCLIPAGTFILGAPDDEFGSAAYSEKQVEVTLTRAFLIQQHELTRGQTRAFGWPDTTNEAAQGQCTSDDCPADDLTFAEALALANEMSRRHDPPLEECYLLSGCSGTLGLDMVCEAFTMPVASVYDCDGFRLPTEAEWEYAARAGTTTATYNGDLIAHEFVGSCRLEPALEPIAWYCNNSELRAHPVGQKQPNA